MPAAALQGLAGAALALAFAAAQAGGAQEPPDFSNDRLAPTLVPVDPGSNRVLGTVGSGDAVVGADRDYFRIDVPTGYLLSALILGPATQPGGAFSFIGVQAGTTMTVPANTISGSQLLGWHTYGTADVGLNLLVPMGFGFDKIGFSGPLPAGPYTFWVQELAVGTYAYEFDFQITPVPEPAVWVMLAAGAAGVLRLSRRRAAQAAFGL